MRHSRANRAPNTTRGWCDASGYICPDHLDMTGIQGVTGFEAKPVSPPTAKATPPSSKTSPSSSRTTSRPRWRS